MNKPINRLFLDPHPCTKKAESASPFSGRKSRNPPRHRGGLGPRRHRGAAEVLRLHGVKHQGQAHEFRIHRDDRGLPDAAAEAGEAVNSFEPMKIPCSLSPGRPTNRGFLCLIVPIFGPAGGIVFNVLTDFKIILFVSDDMLTVPALPNL